MKDPLRPIRKICLYLARAETHTGALEWLERPILELGEWADVVEELEKARKKR